MASEPTGNPVGRPSEYTPERGEAICELIATTEKSIESLHLEYPDVVPPSRTFFAWQVAHAEFRQKVLIAREIKADLIAFRAMEILDDCEPSGEGSMPSALVAKAKEQANHRRWTAACLAPKNFGNRVEHDLGEKAAGTLSELVKRASGSQPE